MASAPTNPTDAANPPRGNAPETLRALLVIARHERCEQLRAAIEQIAPQVRIEQAASVLDALLRTARQPNDLLILDLAIDAAAAPALVRHLTRVAPLTAVLVFDDIDQMLPGQASDIWPWSEAEAALQRWVERRGQRAAPSD